MTAALQRAVAPDGQSRFLLKGGPMLLLKNLVGNANALTPADIRSAAVDIFTARATDRA